MKGVGIMGSPAYSIRTKRLLIRCYNPEDAWLLKSAIDESLDHLSPWLPWTADEPEDIEKKVERLRRNRARFDLDNDYIYGIFLPDNSRLIGSIGLMGRVGDNALEIGYWIHKDHINQGYATEASSALTRAAFDIENVERVEIHNDSMNLRSAAVPRKMGFVKESVVRTNERDKEGNRRKNYIWVMFKEEYLNSDLERFPIEAYDAAGRRIL
jgi:RimJ/RimL family protein N-acetyltransferase